MFQVESSFPQRFPRAGRPSLARSISVNGLWLVACGSLFFAFAQESSNTPVRSLNGTPAVSAPGIRAAVNVKDGQTYVWIPPGAFRMGCSDGDTECFDSEKPSHAETIETGLWMGQTEVTQAAYQHVLGNNPSAHKGDSLPVESVTWDEAMTYCAATGGRLPTAAEWEYAARGGSTWARYGNLSAVAWYLDNSGNENHPVGQKAANAFGLFDMLGSVWEMTADRLDAENRILRGGSWSVDSRYARASSWASVTAWSRKEDTGFRCAAARIEAAPGAVSPEAPAPTPRFASGALMSAEQLPAAAAPSKPAGEETSALAILQKMGTAYSRLTSIHAFGKYEQSQATPGREQSSEARFELAAQGKDHHLMRLKMPDGEAIFASDGASTWKAMSARKEWSRVDAAALSGSGDDEPQAEAKPRADLYGFMERAVFGPYPSFPRLVQDVELVREADYKLAPGTVRCYVIHARLGEVLEELWIDKGSSLVVQRLETSQKGSLQKSLRIRMTSIDVNQPLPDSAFRFEPAKHWTEVDMVLLPGEQSQTLTGSRAASFTLKTLEGERTALAETRGKVVVLDFWATWCPPCRQELPFIEKLRAEFADNVLMYGVNDEESGMVKEFVKKNRYQMTVLMDSNRQVARMYGVTGIPTLVIIDKQGVIRKLYVGSRDEATLRKAIQSVVESN